jgi:hypothetical protein
MLVVEGALGGRAFCSGHQPLSGRDECAGRKGQAVQEGPWLLGLSRRETGKARGTLVTCVWFLTSMSVPAWVARRCFWGPWDVAQRGLQSTKRKHRHVIADEDLWAWCSHMAEPAAMQAKQLCADLFMDAVRAETQFLCLRPVL